VNRRGLPDVPLQIVTACGHWWEWGRGLPRVVREEDWGIRVTARPKGSRLVWYLRLKPSQRIFQPGWLHDFVPAR
jgi:hypothetical protein